MRIKMFIFQGENVDYPVWKRPELILIILPRENNIVSIREFPHPISYNNTNQKQ